MVKYSEMTVSTHLPRSWASGAVCPVCGDKQLSIDPQIDRADLMVCACCTSAFEVATDGLHVHLVKVPAIFPQKVTEIWYRPGELRELAAQMRLANQEQASSSKSTDILDVDELRRRSLGLSKLGNPPERIRTILLGMPGAQSEDVQVVLRDLEVGKDQHERGVMRWAYALLVGLILIVGLVAFSTSQGVVLADVLQDAKDGKNPLQILSALFQPRVQTDPDQASAATQAPGADTKSQFLDTSLLPPVLQTAVPEGVKVLKPPEVVIVPARSTGRVERCPVTVGDAVRLFGGEMKIWTKSRGGWTMISTAPQNVFVPEGMTGGYLVYITKPEFNSVPGPVTIQNLNFLAISCE